MTSGVKVTFVAFIKPESAQVFVAKIADMLSTIKSYAGFRNIQLLPGEADKNQFLLLQEWDSAKDYKQYVDTMRERGVMVEFFSMFNSPPETTIWDMPPLATV